MGNSRDVVNVCFHGIGRPTRTLEPGEDRYWITLDRYREVLDELATWPAVTVSFDDGNCTDLEHGVPELEARAMTASFFVVADRLDAPGSLARTDLLEMRRRGMSIGTHGAAHRPWTGLSDDELGQELVTARARLAAAIGEPIDSAALPLGRYDRRVLGALRRLGYRRVFSSDRRVATGDAWFQPRFSVRADDTATSLRSQVEHTRRLASRVRGWAASTVKQWR